MYTTEKTSRGYQYLQVNKFLTLWDIKKKKNQPYAIALSQRRFSLNESIQT